MARPRKGLLPRLNNTVRLEPSEKELLIKNFGGVQAAIDSLLEKLKKQKEKTR